MPSFSFEVLNNAIAKFETLETPRDKTQLKIKLVIGRKKNELKKKVTKISCGQKSYMEKRDGWFYIKIIGVSEVENPTNKTEIIERHQFKKKTQ